MDFSNQRFSSPLRFECFAKHHLQERSNSAVLWFFFSFPPASLTPSPPSSLRLCAVACSLLWHPMHLSALVCSRSPVPGNVEVFILRRSCQGSSLIANGLESASSFPSDHILLFPNTEQMYLVSTSLFLPHFDIFFSISVKKKGLYYC